MDNIYDIFNQFMTQYDLYPHDIPGFPGYQCDRMGTIYNPDGSVKTPYNSGGYNNVSPEVAWYCTKPHSDEFEA